MTKHLYAIWLGDVLFCFSGETSEPRVDAWTRAVRQLTLGGVRRFAGAGLRLAEIRLPVSAPEAKAARRQLPSRMLEGLSLGPKDAFELLLGWDGAACRAQGIEPGGELEYWAAAAGFALELIAWGDIVPSIHQPKAPGTRRRGGEQAAASVWVPAFRRSEAKETFLRLAENMPPLAAGAEWAGKGEHGSRLEAACAVLHSFLQNMIHAEVRSLTAGAESELSAYKADYRRGSSPLVELWWNSLLTGSRELPVQGSQAEVNELTEQVGEAAAAAGAEAPRPPGTAPQEGRLGLGLRLAPPEEEEGRWKLTFWAEIREGGGSWLPAQAIWDADESEFTLWGTRYAAVQEQLLLALREAGERSEDIRAALSLPAPAEAELEPDRLYRFLKDTAPALIASGITVQMPSRWSREGRRKAGLRLKMELPAEGGEAVKAGVGMDALVSFRMEASIGEQSVSAEELSALVEAGLPFVQFRGEWIEVDPKELRQVLRQMKKQEQGEMQAADWIRLQAEESEDRMWKGLSVTGMETAGLLTQLLRGDVLRSMPPRPIPDTLHGTLRPYQERGYQWLSALTELGFGVCLADDMGLGKTVQVITCLLDRIASAQEEAASGNGAAGRLGGAARAPSLIVCPTSLLGNWQRELQRFAPMLKVHIHHGAQRSRGQAFQSAAAGKDVVLTTYHLSGRDSELLEQVRWSTVVLDEAQYIKNHRTKQSQSVMRLSADYRIAMTGTPVENRLGELWSIFQFLNPGYLGTYHSFRQRYGSGDNEGRLRELHRLVAPFLLRRLKSDPDISKDLPEKLELKTYCPLTETQAALYQGVVNEMLGQIGGAEGMARRGLVLASLTKLKQICDHPQLLRGEGARAGRSEPSGKLETMFELLDSIVENGESALIFTQYVAMGELLVSRLARRYGTVPRFLHGGVPKKERDSMVRSFQEGEGSELFVLSLKAGGVGLNLTRANHVVHYDRWWNPAVENQATDRVFRIGQNRNVQVHKLICQGTLEERIDELIERKKSLSDQVVGSGETWLTEMSNQQLKALIELQEQDWM
ncbi:DEAD/DEAH box helicase [Paenibacillus sp. CN-4]|uniref:DEAD/DEAH box helicase n=1 Tax=Paenibacillus nanchangensis TaxID=3348343 RepID=UPI00397CF7EF